MFTDLPSSRDRKRFEQSRRLVLMFVAGVSLLLVSLLTTAAQVKPKTATRAPATKEVTWPKWDFAFTGPSAWRQYMEHIEDNDKVADGYHEETRYFTHM